MPAYFMFCFQLDSKMTALESTKCGIVIVRYHIFVKWHENTAGLSPKKDARSDQSLPEKLIRIQLLFSKKLHWDCPQLCQARHNGLFIVSECPERDAQSAKGRRKRPLFMVSGCPEGARTSVTKCLHTTRSREEREPLMRVSMNFRNAAIGRFRPACGRRRNSLSIGKCLAGR